MKQNVLTWAVSAMLLGGALASCSSDAVVNDEPQVVDKDTNYYIRVDIANPLENSTRANTNEDPTDYVDGSEEEMKIHEILFIFYNSEMQYVGNSTYKTPTDVGNQTNKPGSVETVLSITVPVSVSAGSLKPAYVMAYVNPATGYNDQQRPFASTLGLTRTLEEMTHQTADATAGIKAHSGYTMTNSVYYDGEEPSIAVPISENQLCVKEEDAEVAVLPGKNTGEDANKKEKVVIYVERVVAKVTLNNATGVTTIPQTGNKLKDAAGTEYTLNFNVLGWGLSNLEKGTFLVKNFRTGSSNCSTFDVPFSLTNMTLTQANSTFSKLTVPAWNFASTDKTPAENWGISGRRSFWAMSPTYFAGAEYPSYADEYTADKSKYALIYRSANDIYNIATGESGTMGKYGSAFGTTQYTLEHTMEAAVVANQQKRAVTCAIVLGQYSFTKDGETTPVTNQDFYIRSGINNEGKSVNIFYAGEKQMKQAYIEKNTKIYYQVAAAEGTEPAKYAPVTWNDVDGKDNPNLANFKIVHPDKTVTGASTPNRYVSLQLVAFDKLTEGTTYYLQDTNGNMTPITDDNIGDANKALYENLNGLMSGVSKFNQGLAYFSVPIMHLWRRGANDKQMGETDWSAILGQYGIVRNHSYTIGISAIDGIGTAIGDPEVPIIPNIDTEKYFVRAELRVQRWRVVPVQNVVLKP